MTWIAGIIVVATGLWLFALAALIVADRARAERFLRKFASSARAHYTEQLVRLLAGFGLIGFAPQMRLSVFFEVFGWVVVVTSAVLLVIPWQWHHKFGQWAIPLAIRHIYLYAVGAVALGTLILASVFL